jgi:hypothetical protein
MTRPLLAEEAGQEPTFKQTAGSIDGPKPSDIYVVFTPDWRFRRLAGRFKEMAPTSSPA